VRVNNSERCTLLFTVLLGSYYYTTDNHTPTYAVSRLFFASWSFYAR